MKTLLTTLLFALLLTFSTNAQTSYTTTSNTFSVEDGTLTGEALNVQNESWDIYKTTSGSKYVIGTSAMGKQYPIWIGEISGDIFEFNGDVYPVRYSKSGTPFILVLTPDSSLYSKYLKKD